MTVSKDYLFGFIVLGFAIFIAGFLTGLLAIAVLNLSVSATDAGMMFLALGFIAGTVLATLIALVIRIRAERKKQS
jgi:cytochrome c biogenesis factor